MQFARIKGYKKDLNTGDIILIANVTDTDGKPLIDTSGTGMADIEIRFSQEGLQKLIREELPTEEQRMQEILDKIHQIRVNRVLNIEKMDDAIEEIKKNAEKDFTNCNDKIEIMRMSAIYRVKLLASAQKRLLSKFSMQEESELSLQLTKLRQAKS
jgi:hypothetical protein